MNELDENAHGCANAQPESSANSGLKVEPTAAGINNLQLKGASDRAFTAAVEIFTRWEGERDRSPVDHVVNAEFRSRRYLNSSERRWVAQAIYDRVRFLSRETWILERQGRATTALERFRLASTTGGNDSAIADYADADDRGADGRGLDHLESRVPGRENPRDYIRIAQAIPEGMAAELEKQLGLEAIAAAEAFNTQAPTTLRVNTLRAGLTQVRAALPEAVPSRYAPWGLELPRRVNVFDLPGYRAGWFEVQEEASQIAALAADVRPGNIVIEIGAGAGGKSLALAAQMENSGRLIALDSSAPRIHELQRRAQRAGVRIVEAEVLPTDSLGAWQPGPALKRTLKTFHGVADCVFIDAPCTGSGVLRRSPDAKWRSYDVDVFTALQYLLLAQSSEFVAPGGSMVYVTCAFEEAQNEAVIKRFLASTVGQGFRVEPPLKRLTAAWRHASDLLEQTRKRAIHSHVDPTDAEIPVRSPDRTAWKTEIPPNASLNASKKLRPDALAALVSGSYLRTWPHRHNLDAFFIACLRRK